jgi:hypothetical protein
MSNAFQVFCGNTGLSQCTGKGTCQDPLILAMRLFEVENLIAEFGGILVTLLNDGLFQFGFQLVDDR